MWGMPTSWPEFMRHDPIGGLFYSQVETRFAETLSRASSSRPWWHEVG